MFCAVSFVPVITSFVLSADVPLPSSRNDLLAEGGFEAPHSHSSWYENNWDHCSLLVKRDRTVRFEGNQSLHVRLPTADCVNFQYVQPISGIQPGDQLGLHFAVKGTEDPHAAPAVRAWLMHREPPYDMYFETQVRPGPDWSVHDVRLTLGKNVHPDRNAIMFVFDEPGEFWIDDVKLYQLPEQSPAPPLTGNQVKNGSFEVGRDRWYATFREAGGYRHAPAATEANIRADLFVEKTDNAPHGRNVMRFPVFQDCLAKVTSAYFPLRYGHPAIVSLYMKGTEPDLAVDVSLGHGRFYPAHHLDTKRFMLTTEWKRYEFSIAPAPSTAGTYFIELQAFKPGTYWVDSVTVYERDFKPSELHEAVVGWQPIDDRHPGNIFPEGEEIRFKLLGYDPTGSGSIQLRGHVMDAWDRSAETIRATIPLDETGHGATEVELPVLGYGSFKCELFQDGSEVTGPAVEIIYHTPPTLRPLKQCSDSFFGGHCELTPYNLHVAELAGFRWLRLHPPLHTKWVVVEPQPYEFVFHTAGVERAASQGFQILGTFGTTPTFYSSAPPGKATGNVFSNYAPTDWVAWKQYIRRTVEAYRPWIHSWENWNEPDGGFLQVRPDQDRVQIYMQILEATNQVLSELDFRVVHTGGAIASLHRPFMKSVLDAGGGRFMNRLSFHHYGDVFRPDLFARLQQIRGYAGEQGGPLEVWHTEGGRWLHNSPSWLKTSGIDNSGLVSIGEGAASLTRMIAMLKAAGIRKHFHYTSHTHPAGHTVYRHGHNLADVNGIPHAQFGSHTAAVWLLEEAEGIHFGYRDISSGRNGAQVAVAEFRRAGRPLYVIWSDRPVAAEAISELARTEEVRAFDMMGNGITPPAEITRDPVYYWLE